MDALQIMPVYCDALSMLENLETTLQALNAIASFLASAFVRAPDPALGPMAFLKFWCATYLHREDLRGMHPPDIQKCLKAVDFVYAGNLANTPLNSNVRSSESPVRMMAVVPLYQDLWTIIFEVHFSRSRLADLPT
jgi:hypothetical protein